MAWEISPGTAVAGLDYGGPSKGVVNLVKGDVAQNITIPLLLNPANSIISRTFTVQLSAPTGGSPYTCSVHPTLGSTVVAIVPPYSRIAAGFVTNNVSARATSVSIRVPVKREGLLTIPVRIVYSTYDISAKAGSDYSAQALSTVTFSANEGESYVSVAPVPGGKTGVSFGVRIVRVEAACSEVSKLFECTGEILPNAECVVTLVDSCGDGKRTGSEACDDGNRVALGEWCGYF